MKQFIKRLNPLQRLVAVVAVAAYLINLLVEFKIGGVFHGTTNAIVYLYFGYIGWLFAQAKFEQDVHDALTENDVLI